MRERAIEETAGMVNGDPCLFKNHGDARLSSL
jgi:hypothetical protein